MSKYLRGPVRLALGFCALASATMADAASCPAATFALAPKTTPSVGANESVAVGNSPLYLATGRFNADNYTDLVTANLGDDSITVLLGDGDGTFTAAPTLFPTASPTTNGARPASLVSADFNNDLRGDLAVTNRNSGVVDIFLGNGDGTFVKRPTPIAVGSFPTSIDAGRIDGNTSVDLVIGTAEGRRVAVLLGDGAGGFAHAAASPFTVAGIPRPGGVYIGQFTGGAANDIAVLNGRASNDPAAIENLVLLLGAGNGTFTVSQTLAAHRNANGSAGRGQVVDIDGDGDEDLVVANWSRRSGGGDPVQPFNAIAVFRNTPTGLAAAQYVDIGGDVSGGAAADFNRDGLIDLAASNAAWSFAGSVALANGSGGFFAPTSYAAASNPLQVVTPDLDLSGAADLVVMNQPSNTLTVYMNQCTGNSQPVANNYGGAGFSVNEDGTIVLPSLVANDFDPDPNTLTVTAIVTPDLIGSATLNAGVVTYATNGAFELLEDGDSVLERFDYTLSDGAGGTATATVTVVVEGISDPRDLAIAFDESATPATVVAGTSLPFAIAITNNGAQLVSGGTVSGASPSWLSFPPSSACTTTSGTFTCGFGPIAAGQTLTVAATALVAADAPADGSIAVTVAGNAPDPTSANDSDGLTRSFSRVNDAEIALTATAAPTLGSGDAANYAFRVKSAGPSLGAHRVATTLDGLAGATWTCTATNGGICPAASGTGAIDAEVALPPGAQLDFVIDTAVANGATVYAFTARVTPVGSTADSNASNDEAFASGGVPGDRVFENGFE